MTVSMFTTGTWLARVASLTILAAAPDFASLAADARSVAEPAIDFQRDIRPILSGHCFKCHGPDDKARKANLRLDLRDAALAPAKSGGRAIVAGKPDESELARRIFANSADDVMPPPEAKRPLSDGQKAMLKKWIASGAEYTPHWAFVPPKQIEPLKVKQTDWPRNTIDHFVLARLEKEGLQPSPAANKYTLVRRLYLDLIGLPPTPEELDAFVHDNSPEAHDKLVESLLASPHYGERWARRWLDLARYADTNGYEKDRRRSIWPYRDWVIRAINADMPFDQFTIEQIAGDMLPNAAVSQRVATGFHRNTMLNEEGGIDPLEFRFHAMTDRVSTTAATWLGLTMGCAQCHTHKFDPIQHQEYYQFMAFMNNADEPEIEVPNEELARRGGELEARIGALTAELPNRFPVEETRWHEIVPRSVVSAEGATVEKLKDGSIRFSGKNADKDVYTFEFGTELEKVSAIQLEILSDPALPRTGPGRSPEGDLVLSELRVSAANRAAGSELQAIKFSSAKGDFSSNDRLAAQAVDGKADTGWLLRKAPSSSAVRIGTFTLAEPIGSTNGTHWVIRLEQQAGKSQTIGRLRVNFGTQVMDDRSVEVRRREHFERKFEAWMQRERARVVRWTLLRPTEAKSNLPLLTVLDDNSILASGDQTKSDTYELKFQTELRGITAIRVEALPDERLPKRGPGRVYYEGPIGDFTLTEFTLLSNGQPKRFARASHSFSTGQFIAAAAIDGDPQSGWGVDGGQGREHSAVFSLVSPLESAQEFTLKMLFERHYSAGLGRFRIWATDSREPADASDLPREIEDLLLSAAGRTGVSPVQYQRLLEYFVTVVPELADARQEINRLRRDIPAFPTTLVMAERPPENPRRTHVQKRGEFLQALERVDPGVPAALHSFPNDAPRNRLNFARWLVDARNPLVGRVVMNRQWAAFFGSGLVRTIEDFGFQGELPSHPELLDWLAVEFIKQGWSLKKMHRLIVTSATYRQSSQVTPQLLEKDPQNRLLARSPRVRLEGELIRDLALRASGLYAPKLGGPSVFPPQPPGVTTEGAYGALEWKVSEGADRYRRGLYTFSKRTAPFAMFTTFDAPTGEACVARREVSNTPLQSLTVMNDTVFVEAAQALGGAMATRTSAPEVRVAELFRRCLSRPPDQEELASVLRFYHAQKKRFETKELDATPVGGPGEGDVTERAAWTSVARALLNLDETITKS